MINNYSIIKYSKESLAIALSNELTPPTEVVKKQHYHYFCEYFGNHADGIGVKTILIECKYLSKSYLIDYSNYYSTCYNNYDRFCKRVHFFSNAFTNEQFTELISKSNPDFDFIWEGYLGYIVVKPLPNVVIGATLLKTYKSTPKNKRCFPSTKTYKINLFGKELKIDSLAFQEQDSVVSACASSALWSALHKLSDLFQTPLPSPSDITKSAKSLFYTSGRIFPNNGLDPYQIGNAIEAVGLVSELRNGPKLKDINWIKAFIYAYNKMGLPVLLGIKIDKIGLHLITVSGYRESNKKFAKNDGLMLKAEGIERFYTHDDQIGPFSRLGFTNDGKIETSWPGNDGKNINAELVSIFIPLHHKIRLNFENIYAKVNWIDLYFKFLLTNAQISWDIYLDFSNNYKKEVSELDILQSRKLEILLNSYPKYIWVAKGYINEELSIDLIFDATEISKADFCISISLYKQELRDYFAQNKNNESTIDFFQEHLTLNYLHLIEKSSIG